MRKTESMQASAIVLWHIDLYPSIAASVIQLPSVLLLLLLLLLAGNLGTAPHRNVFLPEATLGF